MVASHAMPKSSIPPGASHEDAVTCLQKAPVERKTGGIGRFQRLNFMRSLGPKNKHHCQWIILRLCKGLPHWWGDYDNPNLGRPIHQAVFHGKDGAIGEPAGSSFESPSKNQELGHDFSFFWALKHPVFRTVKSLRTGTGNSLPKNCEIPKSFPSHPSCFFLLFYLHHQFFPTPQCCHGEGFLPNTAPALARIVPKRTSTVRTCSPLRGDGIHHSLQGISWYICFCSYRI